MDMTTISTGISMAVTIVCVYHIGYLRGARRVLSTAIEIIEKTSGIESDTQKEKRTGKE